MNSIRRQLPDAPLRGSAVTANVIGLGAVLGLAWVARSALLLGELYPLKAGVSFAIVMLVVFVSLRGNHPFARFGLANQITTARAVLVALVASLIGEPRLQLAAAGVSGTGLLVAVLDGVDGWLARRSRMASAFGARFDMEIDALFVLALSIIAWRSDKAGAWVVLSGSLRYLFVAAGWVYAWMRDPLPASRRRQAICVIQIVSLLIVILPVVRPPLSNVLAATALAALCCSFLVDVVWLRRHAGGR